MRSAQPADLVEWVDPAFGPGRSPRPVHYRPNQLIVELGNAQRVAEALGVADKAIIETAEALKLARITLPPGSAPVADHLRRLSTGPGALPIAAAPNYVLQPWVSSGGQGWPEPSTTVPPISPGGAAVTTVVFDSGLREGFGQGHPYLANAAPVEPGPDTVPVGPGNSMELFDCHGMFVSGVLLCNAPAATVRVRKVFTGGQAEEWDVAKAMDDYLSSPAAAGVRMANLSFGAFAEQDQPPLALQRVIAKYPAVLFVAAAGNTAVADRNRPVFPAAFDTVVGVGALDKTGRRPAPFSDVLSADVWARGDSVANAYGAGSLTMPDGTVRPFGGTAIWSGTSFAAPRVCGELTRFLAGPALGGIPPGFRLLAQAAIAWLRAEFPGGLVGAPAARRRLWPLPPRWPLRP